jgi:hypothetical protein
MGFAALHPDLAAHCLDHTAEEFDCPDPGLTFIPDLGPQHAVLAPKRQFQLIVRVDGAGAGRFKGHCGGVA